MAETSTITTIITITTKITITKVIETSQNSDGGCNNNPTNYYNLITIWTIIVIITYGSL